MSSSRAPTFSGLPVRGRIYILAVMTAAAGAAAAEIVIGTGPDFKLGLFIAAVILCGGANLFEVFAPANFSFQPNLVIFLASALLLPPWATFVLAGACYLPGWFVHRFPWYMVMFNVGNYVIAAMGTLAFSTLGPDLTAGWSPDLWQTALLVTSALVFVGINHALIIGVVWLARGRALSKSASDMSSVVPIDLALAACGLTLVVLWTSSPSLVLLAAGPMVLIYHALWVPQLRHKSRTDPKTGLYNSEYFSNAFDDALEAARGLGREVAVVMIDLDQLRQINNRHGHLMGDRMIKKVADVVSQFASEGDGIAARFGGDELCLLYPGMTMREARSATEKMRAAIEQVDLDVGDEQERVTITVSAGIAAFPDHGDTVDELIRAADEAVYDAKIGGRNRVRAALPIGVQSELDRGDYSRPKAAPTHPGTAEFTPAAFVGARSGTELLINDDASGYGISREATAERAEEPASEPTLEKPDGEAAAAPRSARLIPFYAGALCLLTAVIAAVSGRGPIVEAPILFCLLVGSVMLLDAARIDVFERANLSPAAVPELALAFFFGPLGPIAVEVLIAFLRFARRDPFIKWSFDLGALSLAGVAAAGVFSLMHGTSEALLILGAAAAGVAFYAVNSGLLAIVMGLAEGRGPLPVWRERCAWMVPHYVVFGLLAGTFIVCYQSLGLSAFAIFGFPMLMLWIAEKQYLDRSRSTVSELRAKNDELESANSRLHLLLDENRHLLGRMHRSYLSTITSLARTVEAKDPYTSGHTERVAQIALLLAEELGFDEKQLAAVNVGAIIHDIGKIGIRDHILLKAGPLDSDEFAEMRRHPEISSYIVAELELPAIVKHMVRSHHERYDGGGYPDGLGGEEIPLSARILSVADALDAMTSDRPYRKALPLEVARAEIQRMSGEQFCPVVVAALSKVMEGPAFASAFAGQADGSNSNGPDEPFAAVTAIDLPPQHEGEPPVDGREPGHLSTERAAI